MSTDYRDSRRVAFEREDRGVEQRQLFAIFFAAVVVAMVVFLLGVLAGKGRGPAAGAGAPAEGRTEAAAAPVPEEAVPAALSASEAVAAEPAQVDPDAEAAATVSSAPIPAATSAPEPAVVAPPLTSPPRSTPAPLKVRALAASGTAAKASGAFAVQVLASSDPAKAKTLVQRLKSKGYAAYVVTDGGDKLYRVRVGHYEARDGAEALKARLVKGERLREAWIVTPPGTR